MNRIIKYIAVSVVLLALAAGYCNVHAQKAAPKYPEFHYFTVSVSGGYSAFLSDFGNTKLLGGGAAILGVGYEYYYRSFWLSLGIETEWDNSALKFNQYDHVESMQDTEGDLMNYHYLSGRWQDNHSAVYLNIPFTLGFGIGGFYMGVGAKAGMNVYGHAESVMEYRTTGVYDRYVQDFEDMPNHFYDNYEVRNRYRIKYAPAASIIGVIGYEVASFGDKDGKAPVRLKLGAYAEYGFLKAYENAEVSEQVGFDEKNPSQLVLKPYIMSNDIRPNSFNNLFVGIKATFLFELPVPQKCNCLQTERGASWRNNAPRVTRKQRKSVQDAQKQTVQQ